MSDALTDERVIVVNGRVSKITALLRDELCLR